MDVIICKDRADAGRVIDMMADKTQFDDFEFFSDGRIGIILNCRVEDLKIAKNSN